MPCIGKFRCLAHISPSLRSQCSSLRVKSLVLGPRLLSPSDAALLVESIVVDMVATLATARAADVAEFAGSRHGRSGLFDDSEHSRNLRSILRESKEVVTATWAARLTSRGNNFVLRRFVGPAHQAYKVSKGFSILRLL